MSGPCCDASPVYERLDSIEEKLARIEAKLAASPKSPRDQTIAQCFRDAVARIRKQPMDDETAAKLFEHFKP